MLPLHAYALRRLVKQRHILLLIIIAQVDGCVVVSVVQLFRTPQLYAGREHNPRMACAYTGKKCLVRANKWGKRVHINSLFVRTVSSGSMFTFELEEKFLRRLGGIKR